MASQRTTAQINGSEHPKSAPDTGTDNDVLEGLLPANWRELVGPDPNRPGEDRWRLLRPDISVWAIIGHLPGGNSQITSESLRQTADDYAISEEDVAVAIAYYREHREAIDARLKVNEMAVS